MTRSTNEGDTTEGLDGPTLGTLPTLGEWRKRTWYGRFKLVMLAPMTLLGYAIVLAFGLALAVVLGVLLGIVKTLAWVAKRWPSTYKGAKA